MSKWAVYLSNLQYGCAHVEAETKEEAIEMAKKLYESRSIDWYSDELTDIDPEEED